MQLKVQQDLSRLIHLLETQNQDHLQIESNFHYDHKHLQKNNQQEGVIK